MYKNSDLRTTLLHERASLEQRLRHVNFLLQSEGMSSSCYSSSTCLDQSVKNGASYVDSFSDTIGLAPESGRFLLFLLALLFIYVRGRAIFHAVVVLLLSSSVTAWALSRRLSRSLRTFLRYQLEDQRQSRSQR